MSGAQWHGLEDSCFGFVPKTMFTVACPEPVTCEIRLHRDGVPQVWRRTCTYHADVLEGTLQGKPSWFVERRNLEVSR